MGHLTHQPTPLTGCALVKLKTGAQYEGHVVYDPRGHVVTIEGGRLRVVSMVGGESTITYRPPVRTITWPLRVIDHIAWR